MKEKLSEDILFNRQVNYVIIEKLWEYLNKGKDKQELYNLIGINKNMYCRIRMADTYNCVDLEKRWGYANSSLRKMGLSKEIMTGIEMIELDEVTRGDWEEYLNYRYKDKGEDEDKEEENKKKARRISSMQLINRKVKNAFEKLKADKRDTRDIAKLFYFFTYGRAVTLDMPDAEMVDLRDSLNNVNIEKMKICDKPLRKEIYQLLKEKYRQLDIIMKYESL